MLPTGCTPSTETCCTDAFAIADHLLTSVFDALNGCITEACGGALVAYVTLGQGDDAIPNALTVELDGSQPTPGSVTNSGMAMPIVIARTQFTVRLRESGWLMAVAANNGIHPPDPVEQHNAARHAYSHGELMYRQLLSMRANRSLVPTTVHGCLNAVVGPLVPMRPLAGVIGFSATVSVDLPWG